MSDQGFHIGPTAPTSLSGAHTFQITLPKVASVTIQAALFSNVGYVVHWRVAYAASLTATDLDTAEGALSHLGSATLQLSPTTQAYLYVLVTDSAGTHTNGGTSDRLMMTTVGL